MEGQRSRHNLANHMRLDFVGAAAACVSKTRGKWFRNTGIVEVGCIVLVVFYIEIAHFIVLFDSGGQ